MKTPDLIKDLSGQLREFRQADGLPVFLAKWSAGAALGIAFVLCVLPFRQDLASKIGEPRFLLESGLWLVSLPAGFGRWCVWSRGFSRQDEGKRPDASVHHRSLDLCLLGLPGGVRIFSSGTSLRLHC